MLTIRLTFVLLVLLVTAGLSQDSLGFQHQIYITTEGEVGYKSKLAEYLLLGLAVFPGLSFEYSVNNKSFYQEGKLIEKYRLPLVVTPLRIMSIPFEIEYFFEINNLLGFDVKNAQIKLFNSFNLPITRRIYLGAKIESLSFDYLFTSRDFHFNLKPRVLLQIIRAQ